MYHYFLMRLLLLVCLVSGAFNLAAQNLTISGSGQTGTSGTNWSTSGSNPVTINITGTASIHTNVITGYLNAGISVIVNNTTVGTNINSSISKTAGTDATLTVKDLGCIRVADNVTIGSTSNILHVVLWADSDNSQGGNVDDYLYCGSGATISSNGGRIILAGGPDNGNNGGTSSDGIPDGFAWNGSDQSTYGANVVGGLTLGPRGGTGSTVSLLSNGGEIICRGATSGNNSFPGITSQGNIKIESGTGKITMYGKSSTGHAVEFTYGAAPSIAISSSSTSTPAISLKGESTSGSGFGFWASNNIAGNVLIQSTAATGGGVTIEGTNTNSFGLCLGVSNTGIISQVLSQSGTITLKGIGSTNSSLFLYGDTYIGNRKDATAVQGIVPAVTGSSAGILIQANDQYTFSNTSTKNTNFNSTGPLTIESYTSGYSNTLSWTGNVVFGSTFSNITLGKSTENYSFTLNNTLAATGNITAYSSTFTFGNGVGLSSSGAGNITINAKGSINTSGTTRRTISTVNGNINLYADSDASGDGQLDADYMTCNPGTGNTTFRAETLLWETSSNAVKPYINGTGSFTIEPADASFQNVSTSWFLFDQDANGIAGLTIGKTTNTGNVTHETTDLTIAGPIAFYGGWVTLSANITSSATGDIFLKANNNRSGAATIDANASIFKTGGTGTLTMQGQARVNSGIITASGSGLLNVVLWSDYANLNNGGVAVSSITTNGGHLWVGGSNSNGGSYTWNGLTVGDGPSTGSVNNNYNGLDFVGPVSTNGGDVLIWAGNGYSTGINGIGVLGATRYLSTGNGDITLMADNIDANDLVITSTGILNLVPDGGSYPAAVTWNGSTSSGNLNLTGTFDRLFINNFASLAGLTIGYFNEQQSSGTPVIQANTSNITISNAVTVNGPIKLYGTALTVSQNLASSASGDISLLANTLSIGNGITLASQGNLIIQPVTAATTIGLAGGAGTLAVSSAYFNTNFTDGFAEIRIGHANAGSIEWGSAITLKDPLRIITSANLQLNETVELGNNDFHFIGNNISPASGKFIKTIGAGKLFMNIGNNAAKLFPVGVTNYNPVTITNHTGATDEFYATISSKIFFRGGTSGSQITTPPRVDLTWNIGNNSATTGSGNVDMLFGWNAGDVSGSLTNPKLFHYATAWQEQTGTTTVDAVARTLSYPGYSGSFSPFAIVQANASLPVSWLSIQAKRIQRTVEVRWSTSAEHLNRMFVVERRTVNTDFTAIGERVAGAGSTTRNDYLFTDPDPSPERSWYRVKQVDIDGKSSFSSIVGVAGIETGNFSLTAAPGSQQLLLSAPTSLKGSVSVSVYDAGGRPILRRQVQAGLTVLNTAHLISGGVYFITVRNGNEIIYSTRFVH